VVGIQVEAEPYKDDHGKHDKSRAVFHCREKGQQKSPKGKVISRPDQGERVSAALFDLGGVSRVFPEPREPRGRMAFDDQSVQYPDGRKSEQPVPFRPDRSEKSGDDINQTGNSQP
jgi:hypothetical protein